MEDLVLDGKIEERVVEISRKTFISWNARTGNDKKNSKTESDVGRRRERVRRKWWFRLFRRQGAGKLTPNGCCSTVSRWKCKVAGYPGSLLREYLRNGNYGNIITHPFLWSMERKLGSISPGFTQFFPPPIDAILRLSDFPIPFSIDSIRG